MSRKNKPMQKDKVDIKAAIIFISIAVSSQCGGGFAAGSTPWTYFFQNTGFYGLLPKVVQSYFALFMPLVVACINCFIIYFFMKFAMEFRTFDYANFLEKYTKNIFSGKLSKLILYVYEFNYNWLLIVCMALAYSSSGSALNELTGIPYIITTFVIGVIMLIVCMKGTQFVRKNAVYMSIVIIVTLLAIQIPNLFYNISSGKLSSELLVISNTMTTSIAENNGSFITYLLTAFAWAYIFSGQNLGGFGAYVNHAQIFNNKRTLKISVIISVIINWLFLELSVINLASNYSLILENWKNGKAVYNILVVQNGVGSVYFKNILLVCLTVAIFFATISTAINYAQGFNDRFLNWYEKKINESKDVSELKRNKRATILTLIYIVITWGISQAGLTVLVSKGLTVVSFITMFTLIIPTIINVVNKQEVPRSFNDDKSKEGESI